MKKTILLLTTLLLGILFVNAEKAPSKKQLLIDSISSLQEKAGMDVDEDSVAKSYKNTGVKKLLNEIKTLNEALYGGAGDSVKFKTVTGNTGGFSSAKAEIDFATYYKTIMDNGADFPEAKQYRRILAFANLSSIQPEKFTTPKRVFTDGWEHVGYTELDSEGLPILKWVAFQDSGTTGNIVLVTDGINYVSSETFIPMRMTKPLTIEREEHDKLLLDSMQRVMGAKFAEMETKTKDQLKGISASVNRVRDYANGQGHRITVYTNQNTDKNAEQDSAIAAMDRKYEAKFAASDKKYESLNKKTTRNTWAIDGIKKKGWYAAIIGSVLFLILVIIALATYGRFGRLIKDVATIKETTSASKGAH